MTTFNLPDALPRTIDLQWTRDGSRLCLPRATTRKENLVNLVTSRLRNSLRLRFEKLKREKFNRENSPRPSRGRRNFRSKFKNSETINEGGGGWQRGWKIVARFYHDSQWSEVNRSGKRGAARMSNVYSIEGFDRRWRRVGRDPSLKAPLLRALLLRYPSQRVILIWSERNFFPLLPLLPFLLSRSNPTFPHSRSSTPAALGDPRHRNGKLTNLKYEESSSTGRRTVCSVECLPWMNGIEFDRSSIG